MSKILGGPRFRIRGNVLDFREVIQLVARVSHDLPVRFGGGGGPKSPSPEAQREESSLAIPLGSSGRTEPGGKPLILQLPEFGVADELPDA